MREGEKPRFGPGSVTREGEIKVPSFPTASSGLWPSPQTACVCVYVPVCVCFTPKNSWEERFFKLRHAHQTQITHQDDHHTPQHHDSWTSNRSRELATLPGCNWDEACLAGLGCDWMPPRLVTLGEHADLGPCHALSASLVPLPLLDFPSASASSDEQALF